MCGSGVTACHNLLALEHAGLPAAPVRRVMERMDSRPAAPGRDGSTGLSGRHGCADVYLRDLFDIVRANVAADPNQTLTDAQENQRRTTVVAWSIDDSTELYQVNAWGKGYFCVNPPGTWSFGRT